MDEKTDAVIKELSSDLYLKTEKLLIFRLAFAGVGIFVTSGIGVFAQGQLIVLPIFSAVAWVIIYSGASLAALKLRFLLKSDRALTNLNAVLIGSDIFALTALVHSTGGVDSDIYVLYLIPILLSSYTFGRLGIRLTATFVSISYVGLLLIENSSMLPYLFGQENKEGLAYISYFPHNWWRRVFGRSLLLVSLALFWARFCEYMSGLAELGANRLREQLSANTTLAQEMQSRAAREALVNSINAAVRGSLDLNQIFETTVDELGRALNAKSCAIVCHSAYADEPPVVCESVNTNAPGQPGPEAGPEPGPEPGHEPGREPGQQSGQEPGQHPGQEPVQQPGQESGQQPGQNLENGDERGIFDEKVCAFVLEHKSTYAIDDNHNLRKIFVFKEPERDPVFAPIKEAVAKMRFSSLIIKPMMYADESKGVLLIGERDKGREWTQLEFDLIGSVAGQVAVAIEHAELVDQLSRKNKDLLHKNLNLDAKNLELRAAQSQLIHQEKMASLGRLVAGIAHELNNPINFVHGNLPYLKEYFEDLKRLIETVDRAPSDLVKNELSDFVSLKSKLKYDFLTTDLDNIIADLNEGAERIRHIIKNLRSFSRLDEAELKEASIQEGLESTLKILSQYYGRDKIQAQTEYEAIPPVLCFPGQLNQVWMNLLSNAAQAVQNEIEPLVRIKTEVEGAKVVVSIQDNGPGIKPEVQSKIFEPFFTTKPVGQGTGLGLSICHSIIERHGGRIICESELGDGTTFKVEIPIYARASDLAKTPQVARHDPD